MIKKNYVGLIFSSQIEEYVGAKGNTLVDHKKGNFDERDNISKISTVTNLSSLIVSPDDVVGILGQKHFWKARRKIAK